MKISALFPVVVAITLANFVSGFSLLDGGDYDLEVRDEFLDDGASDLWARDFDEELEIVARDIIDAVEDILYARASRAAKFAWEGLAKDAAISKAGQVAQQALDANTPKPNTPSPWQRAMAGAQQQVQRPAARPSVPKPPAGPSRQPAQPQVQPGSRIIAAVRAQEQIRKANAQAAAQAGANAIIAKQKVAAGVQKAAAQRRN